MDHLDAALINLQAGIDGVSEDNGSVWGSRGRLLGQIGGGRRSRPPAWARDQGIHAAPGGEKSLLVIEYAHYNFPSWVARSIR